MDRDFYGLQKQIWRTIRNQRKEIKDFVTTTIIDENTWIQYLTELYKSEKEDTNRDNNDKIKVIVETTDEEINNTIHLLKNRKSPGEDTITNEMIKHGGEKLHKEIIKLIKQIFQESRIPDDWKTSIVIPIFKKGDKQNPNNYRPINLLNSMLKITTKIIQNKLTEMIPLCEEQQGYRLGRSCIDAIFVVRQIVEKSLEFNKPAYLCFIDLEKAFDRLELKDILNILEQYNIPNGLILLIQDIFSNNFNKVKSNGRISEKKIKIGKGVRQGDSLSPLLFNLVMNEIIKEVRTGHGYKMGDNELNMVCYADDVVLMANTEDDLQRLLYRFHLSCQKYNMKISVLKSRVLTVSKMPIRCKLELEGKVIEQVMSLKYLGTEINSWGMLQNEVLHQVNNAARIAGCMNDVIWRNKYLRKDTKVKIYKAVVRPILTYAAETRADTTKTKQMLETTEMNILRKIVGKTRRDRVRNENIRQQLEIEKIGEWVERRRNEWNAHISRMATDRLVRTARDNIPDGKRSPGRPRKRWRNS